MRDFRADLTEIFDAAADFADPCQLVRTAVLADENSDEIIIKEKSYSRKKVFLFAFGKAAFAMAQGFLSVCPVEKGVVASNSIGGLPENIACIKAGHPLPDSGSVLAGEKMLELAQEADSETLCVFLVSGGGSALLCSPADGLSLKDKMKVSDLLIKSGADIEEINTVRRQLSKIKGGRLAAAAKPARCVTLAVSDVLSGSPSAIASGPTAQGMTAASDALEVLAKYGLTGKLPESVINALHSDNCPDDTDFGEYHILAENTGGMYTAAAKALALGYRPNVYHAQLSCDVDDAAVYISSCIGENLSGNTHDSRPVCMVFGGEVTVKVTGEGKGGRCQHLALKYLMQKKPSGTFGLFASTDGMDGPTDAAGAFTDDDMDISEAPGYAEKFDSYNFFDKCGGLFKTGLTGTNINDLYIILIPGAGIKPELRVLAEASACT